MDSLSPQICYSSLLGQDLAKNMVRRALERDRVPHAYLFRGPDGVGKKTFARGVAAALNCRERDGFETCGHCISCKKLLSGNHPDFVVVEPEKDVISVKEMLAICRELYYAPYESKVRVVVLEDVHRLRQEAANALLKTLEEPPSNNILILTADSAQDVLSTISSRCQVLPFYGLSEDEIAHVLGRVGDETLAELRVEDRFALGRLAEGSPGFAMHLARTEVLAQWQSLRILLLDPLYKRDSEVGEVLARAEGVASLKKDFSHLLSLLRFWIRDHLLVLQGVATPHILAPWGMLEDEFSWSIGSCYQALEMLEDVEKKLVYNCNLGPLCEVLFFKLLNLR